MKIRLNLTDGAAYLSALASNPPARKRVALYAPDFANALGSLCWALGPTSEADGATQIGSNWGPLRRSLLSGTSRRDQFQGGVLTVALNLCNSIKLASPPRFGSDPHGAKLAGGDEAAYNWEPTGVVQPVANPWVVAGVVGAVAAAIAGLVWYGNRRVEVEGQTARTAGALAVVNALGRAQISQTGQVSPEVLEALSRLGGGTDPGWTNGMVYAVGGLGAGALITSFFMGRGR